MKLLLDEMYSLALSDALGSSGIEALTAFSLGLSGKSDGEIFENANANAYTILTENVADLTKLAGEYLTTGAHHPGVLIAQSSRFSRRPSGISAIALAVSLLEGENLEDRVIYLDNPTQNS